MLCPDTPSHWRSWPGVTVRSQCSDCTRRWSMSRLLSPALTACASWKISFQRATGSGSSRKQAALIWAAYSSMESPAASASAGVGQAHRVQPNSPAISRFFQDVPQEFAGHGGLGDTFGVHARQMGQRRGGDEREPGRKGFRRVPCPLRARAGSGPRCPCRRRPLPWRWVRFSRGTVTRPWSMKRSKQASARAGPPGRSAGEPIRWGCMIPCGRWSGPTTGCRRIWASSDLLNMGFLMAWMATGWLVGVNSRG